MRLLSNVDGRVLELSLRPEARGRLIADTKANINSYGITSINGHETAALIMDKVGDSKLLVQLDGSTGQQDLCGET